MKLDKRIENERLIYTPFTTNRPKLHEKGYFTDNMRAFDNLNDPNLYYVYGELIDYNDDCERRYRSNTKWCNPYGEDEFYEENYAFYIPESSIPKKKQKWYRRNRDNTPTFKGYVGPIPWEFL